MLESRWIEYFSPCGATLVEGYGNTTCVSEECGKTPCLAVMSFGLARSIVDGGNPQEEKGVILEYLKEKLIGKSVVDIDGRIITAKEGEAEKLSERVFQQSQKILDGIESCIQNTKQISSELIDQLNPQQQEIRHRLYELHLKTTSFKGNVLEARELATEMRNALEQALDNDMGHISLIARQAIGYGLADKLGFIDPTGLIFIGDPAKIEKMPQK